MAIPTLVEAVGVLLGLDPPTWLVEHSSAVAEVAAFLAVRCQQRGRELDLELVQTAAMLHDVDKALPKDHRLRPFGHGAAGALWLTERGYAELAPAVAHHPATLLGNDVRYTAWVALAGLEERVVAYADKRATQDLVSLDERFRTWEETHPKRAESIRKGRGRAEQLEREVCAAAGIEPGQVERLPWVAAVMQSASVAR